MIIVLNMEKFEVSNSYHQTIVAYDPATQLLYIKIGSNNKVYSYPSVTQAMFKTIKQFNDEGKAIGSAIIYLNDKGSFGKEVPEDDIDWS